MCKRALGAAQRTNVNAFASNAVLFTLWPTHSSTVIVSGRGAVGSIAHTPGGPIVPPIEIRTFDGS